MKHTETIKLFIAGDFCSSDPESVIIGDSLKKIIDDSDLKILNFEGPLPVGAYVGGANHYLKQSKLSPSWCIKNGFNIVGLANNHACDFGEEGLKSTEDAFSDIITLGTGSWDDAYKIRIIEINGKKIGLFSATSADFSSLKNKFDDKDKYGCPWINHVSVPKLISDARDKCDFIIILPHAGVEFMDVPLPEWREIYYNLIDSGADAVIASHPHVPQGWEYYKGKPIFYSLGNFVFDTSIQSVHSYWNNGIVVKLELVGNKIKVFPHLIACDNGYVEIDNSFKMSEHFNTICKILLSQNEYIECVNNDILNIYKKYQTWLLYGLSSFQLRPISFCNMLRLVKAIFGYKMNYKLAMHQLREDSTRFVLERAYKLLSKTQF